MNKRLFGCLLAAPILARFTGFSKEDLFKYTPLNPFERLPDGRPDAPESLWKRLATSSSEEVRGTFWRSQYRSQFVSGWQQTHSEKVLVGRVFTWQYLPVRPELYTIVEPDVRNFGKISNSNQRVIDTLSPGDVLVVDLYGKIDGGAFVGDNLVRAIWVATGNGFIVNGGIRDRQGLDHIDAPVRVGEVTVVPGDLAFCDKEGLSFIAPHLLQKGVEFADSRQLKDDWTAEKVFTRKYKSRRISRARHARLEKRLRGVAAEAQEAVSE